MIFINSSNTRTDFEASLAPAKAISFRPPPPLPPIISELILTSSTEDVRLLLNEKNVFFEECDLREVDKLKSSIEKLRSKLGLFDVLVNNAAHDDRHKWQDVTEEYWDERFATNLRHHFFTIQSVAKDMIKKGEGSIVNIGSNSWWEAVGNFPAYATAKSAVHGLSRTLARDLGQHRIRVNTVVPGWIMTDRQKELWVTPEGLENQYSKQCLPDLIEPVYVARMVLFLASDDGAMCTANNYMVEAGSI